MEQRQRDAIRERLLKRRRALSRDDAETAGAAIAAEVSNRLQSVSTAGQSRGAVAAYNALPGEIDPTRSLALLHDAGRRIVLPVCRSDGHMDFCPWSPGDALVPRAFGVLEPTTEPIDVAEIGAVIVPGVAFDRLGNRLGHGVGYYDRFFDRCAQQSHDPYRLGIAYDFQVVELPAPEPWDIPMHIVISPSEVIDTTLCE